MNPWAALAGAALGAGKAEFVDKPKQRREAEYAARTIRYSPWTGMSKEAAQNRVQDVDTFGSALQGGTAGAMMGQGGMGGMGFGGGEAAGAAAPEAAGETSGALDSSLSGNFGMGQYFMPQPQPQQPSPLQQQQAMMNAKRYDALRG